MYAFFEEDGSYKAGRVLSSSDAALQIELPSGKRSKVKKTAVVFEFAKPEPQALMDQAAQEAEGIDLDFLYELLPQEEFGALDFAPEYFGGSPSSAQQAALVLRLHGAPHYFHRKGKARYKPAPPEILKAAKLAVEKKAAQEARRVAMIEEIKAGQMPPEIAAAMPGILFRPDKNGIAYKALSEGAAALGVHPARLAVERGALKSAFDLHMQRFLTAAFPKGPGHAPLPEPKLPSLPVAAVQSFSIDDITTTEIDDAFSVQFNADGTARVGIHIAAPGVAIAPGDAIDTVGRARMSTVYMPGDKITMLPDATVQAFTLEEGRTMPAVSLYFTAGPDGAATDFETRIEAVPVAANLRHNLLDELVTAESLDARSGSYPFAQELALLWRVAQWMSGERDRVRGKPEHNNRADFSFYVDWAADAPTDASKATVRIETRRRGAPLDKIVSELMILANSTWARQLHEARLPGIFRGQVAGRVRMSTHAGPHEAMGVLHYGWFTSPLRRYSDLVNQRQLLVLVEHGAVAALKAPFKPKDADLFAVISAFDAAYTSYAEFQSQMERFWCLRWAQQHIAAGDSRVVDAVVVKDDLVRLARAPLYLRVAGVPVGEGFGRGRPVRIELLSWDEIDLAVEARYVGEGGAAQAEDVDEAEEDTHHAVDAVALPEVDADANAASAPAASGAGAA